MEYNSIEQEALNMMRRVDFKNISKNDVLSITSKLSELRPDVAKDIIAKFPELAKLIQSSMQEYKEILENIIASDDESLKQVYDIANKDMDNSIESQKQFYEFAEKIHSDLSKCLDSHDLTSEERKEILEQEMEILKTVNDKDAEIRQHDKELVDMVDKKDSEKRRYNWGLITAASTALVVVAGVTVSALGGKIDLKLPKNQ